MIACFILDRIRLDLPGDVYFIKTLPVLVEWPDLLLVGDPLNMDGSVSELARRSRRFARRLEGRYALPATLVDERLSSFEVKARQREAGHRGDYRRQPVDSLAAELILESWLSAYRP